MLPEKIAQARAIQKSGTSSTDHPSPEGSQRLKGLSSAVAGASPITCTHPPTNLALIFRNLLAAEIASRHDSISPRFLIGHVKSMQSCNEEGSLR